MAKNSRKYLIPLLGFLACALACCTSAYGFDSKSGWWYNPSKDGTGVSVEIQGNMAFVAMFTYYDDSRLPVWLTAYGPIDTSIQDRQGQADVFSGTLDYWTGWPLGSPYYAPTSYRMGNMTIVFNSSDDAELTYTIEGFTSVQGDKKKKEKTQQVFKEHLSKFMEDVSPGSLDSRDINGWWYDPSYNGMGFFMEARGGTVFMTWYHYRSDGLPWWWTCAGAMGPSDNQFSCDLMEWQGGSSIGADEYHKPHATAVGSATFTLNADGTALLDWSGTQFHLQRFKFN